jgi:hypothetical protein
MRRIDLLNKVVPGPGQYMRRIPYLLKHEVHGWSTTIEPAYLLEHGTLPVGDDAIAVRNAYAKDWIDNKAPDDVREAFNKEYKDYVVSLFAVLRPYPSSWFTEGLRSHA